MLLFAYACARLNYQLMISKLISHRLSFIITFLTLLSISLISYVHPAFASTLSWTTKPNMPTERVGFGIAATSEGKIYVIGGLDDDSDGPINVYNTVEEYDPSTDIWSTKQNMPTARFWLGAATSSNGKIYAIGGTDPYGAGRLNVVEEYDPATDTWTSKTAMPTAREGMAILTASNAKIYAMGGYPENPNTGGYSRIVEEYDPVTDTWATKANLPYAAAYVGAAEINGKIYVIPELGSGYYSVQIYDLASDTWTTGTSIPTSRYFLGITAHNGKIYAIGGFSRSGPGGTIQNSVATVEVYDPATNTWSSDTSLSVSRYGLGTVLSGGKIYAIGGKQYNSATNFIDVINTVEEGVLDNLPPTVDAGGPYSIGEGGSMQVSATGNDPENGSLTYAWDLDNNGSFETSGQSVNFSAANLDGPSNHTIAVQVTDDGNLSATDQATVNILNVAPTVGTITTTVDPVQVNTSINASASFTDPGTPDTHTAVWDWGDGTTSGTVTESNGSGSVSDSHTYTAAGVYTVKLTVTDDDNDFGDSIFQYVVVYDPSAGYVTGAGTITSPLGAYTLNPLLTGKAIFGFVSRYQNGANVPTGNTQFRFVTAQFTFNSTSYDWLVVGGPKAQYKGSGTINGNGDYGFILTSIDGQINGGGGTDKFRIKIYDKTTSVVIYDNQMSASDTSNPTTVIDSGSIMIHN